MSDWRESSWGDEISLEYGKRLQGYKDAKGRYRVFGANGPVGWTDKPLTEGPGVILGRKGVNRGVEFSKAPFFVIDTAYYVQPKSELDMRWLYYAIKHYKLGDINDGSPIPSTTRSAVYVKKIKGIKTRVKNLTLGKRHSRRECLGPEALRASVPPHGAGYLKGLAKLTPRSRHSLGNGTNKLVPPHPPLASFGNKKMQILGVEGPIQTIRNITQEQFHQIIGKES